MFGIKSDKESIEFKKHINLLGLRVEDRVTGFKGVVATVAFDLYGCIQAIVNPGVDEKGLPMDQHWFDVARLKVIDTNPVMEKPNFESGRQAEGRQGAAEKPPFTKS